MNLVIDIGNSSAKAATFDGGRLVELIANYEPGLSPAVNYDGIIMVSVRGEDNGLEKLLRGRTGRFIKLDHTTPVPIKNLYATPGTLGYDRLAAAVGAGAMFPGRTMLVVDFGTAITYDIVTAEGEYLGGNISPGAGSRFRALHDYTGSLPLEGLPASERPQAQFPARDTRSAIESGVAGGIVAETEYYVEAAGEKFGDAGVIFTGGDADYFAGRVKFPIFAVSELVLRGLNAILEHNANL